jgi:DNA-binding transcriptional ArsR family regulator
MTQPVIEPRFARVASAIGDPTRALMLARLLDGRHYTATELAVHAGVTASTASQHLKLLLDEQLIRVRAQGRHRYFTLADGNVSHALEALLRVADGTPPEANRWNAANKQKLRHARSCYGHLAGKLGVQLCTHFAERGWVIADDHAPHDYQITPTGIAELNRLGVAIAGKVAMKKRMLYGCVDWSERRDHFAGPVAVAMLEFFIERGWLKPELESRVLNVTLRGEKEFVGGLLNVSRSR